MSRSPIALVCTALVVLALADVAPIWAADLKSEPREDQEQQQQQQQQKQQQQRQQQRAQEEQQRPDLLVELTPNLEHQLRQASRLNQRDSADEMPLTEEAYRYELIGPATQESFAAGGGGGRGGDAQMPIVQTGNWFDHVQLANNQKRRSGSGGGAASLAWLSGSSDSLFHSRGQAPRYYHTKEDGPKYSATPLLLADQKEDKAYALEAGPTSANIINNRESASRDSLWTSGLLRDLLIAQEAANRVRRLDQLTRAALAERRLKATGKITRTGANGRFNGIDFLETREKKRRCKVDPNLGVKNPSFCDTDAYFGASDYSTRDVWDSAGKR